MIGRFKDVSKRFSNLMELDTKGEADLYFDSDSKKISAKDQSSLQ